MDEQIKVGADVYGIAFTDDETIDEDPEFINQKLQELQLELDKRTKNRAAYDQAKSTSLEYVKDTRFLLAFLRANSFDVKLSAIRVFKHFQLKLELFGPSKLCSNIDQSDLSEEDQRTLALGGHQWLRSTDSSRRPVMFSRYTYLISSDPNCVVRSLLCFYTLGIVSLSALLSRLLCVATLLTFRLSLSLVLYYIRRLEPYFICCKRNMKNRNIIKNVDTSSPNLTLLRYPWIDMHVWTVKISTPW